MKAKLSKILITCTRLYPSKHYIYKYVTIKIEMKKNEHEEFVGLANLVTKNGEQVKRFIQWAEQKDWRAFHINHYDWWLFPIDQPSRLGFAYTVYENEIQNLKLNPQFIENLKLGTKLLLLSWGWNLEKEERIANPDPNQTWQNWPIRLYKCAQCLALFGLEKELHSVKKLGKLLLKEQNDFSFRGKDLSTLFL